MEIQNFSESNSWYLKARTIYDSVGYEEDVVELDYLLALNYIDMDSIDYAKPFIENHIKVKRELNRYNDVAGGLDILGNLAKRQGNFEEAEAYYKEALELAKNHGEKSLPGLLYRRLAVLYIKMNKNLQGRNICT